MANIRINALSGTATTTNTDDYIALDGTTAGSRKMLLQSLGGVNTVTSRSGQPLVLATGTTGTALTIASATNDIALASTTSGTSTTAAALTAKSLGLTENLYSGGQINSTGGYVSATSATEADLHAIKTGTGAVDASFYAGNNVVGLYDNTNSKGILAYTPTTFALTIGTTGTVATFAGTTSGTSTTAASILGKSLGLTENLRVGGSVSAFGTNFSPLAWGVDSINVNSVGGGLAAFYNSGTASGYIHSDSSSTILIQGQSGNKLKLQTAAGGNIDIGNGSTVVSFLSTVSGTSTTAAALTAKSIGLTENAYVGGTLNVAGVTTVASGTATPAAGSTSARLLFGTTSGFGIYYGSGAPTVSAAQGSIYLRSEGSSTSTRLYVNTDGSTGWTNFTSAT